MKITIKKGGPYLVTGGVPLAEKLIEPHGGGFRYADGRALPQRETYALCRCGHSKNPPFCDGAHSKAGFDGTETAKNDTYADRASVLHGPQLDLMVDDRCAYANFCHRDMGDAWELTEQSDHADAKKEAIIAASECPAGRLTAVTKDGTVLEPELEPAIEVLRDLLNDVGCGLYVKGGIPIESSKGFEYERRNRVVLCRCGHSKNAPFCDGTHIDIKFEP